MFARFFQKPPKTQEDMLAEEVDITDLRGKVEDMHAHKPHFCVATNGLSCRDALRTVDPLPCGDARMCGAPVYLVGAVGEPNTNRANAPPLRPSRNGRRTKLHRRENPIPEKTGLLAWMPPPTRRGKGKVKYGGTFFQGWTDPAAVGEDITEDASDAELCALGNTKAAPTCPAISGFVAPPLNKSSSKTLCKASGQLPAASAGIWAPSDSYGGQSAGDSSAPAFAAFPIPPRSRGPSRAPSPVATMPPPSITALPMPPPTSRRGSTVLLPMPSTGADSAVGANPFHAPPPRSRSTGDLRTLANPSDWASMPSGGLGSGGMTGRSSVGVPLNPFASDPSDAFAARPPRPRGRSVSPQPVGGNPFAPSHSQPLVPFAPLGGAANGGGGGGGGPASAGGRRQGDGMGGNTRRLSMPPPLSDNGATWDGADLADPGAGPAPRLARRNSAPGMFDDVPMTGRRGGPSGDGAAVPSNMSAGLGRANSMMQMPPPASEAGGAP